MNQLYLLGNLGKDPEAMDNGCKFSLATNESWKDKNGEWQKKTTWHTVMVWGDRGTKLLGKIKKGEKVFVSGKLEILEKDESRIPLVNAFKVEHFEIPNRAPGATTEEF